MDDLYEDKFLNEYIYNNNKIFVVKMIKEGYNQSYTHYPYQLSNILHLSH